MLPLIDWDSFTILQDSKVACDRVLELSSGFYDIAFPKQNIKIKDKTLERLWKSEGLQRCTETKKKCFKALQKETKPVKNDTRYKTLLETLKKKLKSYYLNLTDKYKNYNNLGC